MPDAFTEVRKSAKRAYKAREYELAVKLLAPVVAEPSPNPEEAAGDFTAYATALTALSRLDEAAEYMGRAVEASPVDGRLRAKYGEILARTGHHAAAAVQFKQLTEIEPTVADNWVRLASEYNILGQEGDVEVALAKALELNPDHTEAQILQLERSLTADPERDGLGSDVELEAERDASGNPSAGIDSSALGEDYSPPPPPLRHRTWMVVVEAVALCLAALWLRSQVF